LGFSSIRIEIERLQVTYIFWIDVNEFLKVVGSYCDEPRRGAIFTGSKDLDVPATIHFEDLAVRSHSCRLIKVMYDHLKHVYRIEGIVKINRDDVKEIELRPPEEREKTRWDLIDVNGP